MKNILSFLFFLNFFVLFAQDNSEFSVKINQSYACHFPKQGGNVSFEHFTFESQLGVKYQFVKRFEVGLNFASIYRAQHKYFPIFLETSFRINKTFKINGHLGYSFLNYDINRNTYRNDLFTTDFSSPNLLKNGLGFMYGLDFSIFPLSFLSIDLGIRNCRIPIVYSHSYLGNDDGLFFNTLIYKVGLSFHLNFKKKYKRIAE